MSITELTVADLASTGVSTGQHPIEHLRAQLTNDGILSAAHLKTATPNSRVYATGVVTHRQRPATASGVTFINLEDETGFINVIVSEGCYRRHRHVARNSAALVVRGRVERANGVTNLIAERLDKLPLAAPGCHDDLQGFPLTGDPERTRENPATLG